VKLEVGDKVIHDIIHAGAMGAIINAPDPEAAAAAWAKKYPDYVNGAESLQIAKAAEVQARSNRLLAKQNDIADKQIATMNVDKSRNQIWSDNVKIDPTTNRPTINPQFFKDAVQIPMKYQNAPNAIETAKTMLDWGEVQQSDKKIASDPGTVADLTQRLFSLDNPTTEVQLMKAQVDHKLSHDDFAPMLELVKTLQETPIKDPAFKDTLQAAKDSFTYAGSNTADDPMGSANYARFVQNFLPQYLSQSRAGTLQPNALDMRDPKSLISQSIAASKLSLQASVAQQAATPGVSETPPVSLPPLKDRVKDKSYMTGRGMMVWTGTGWRAP